MRVSKEGNYSFRTKEDVQNKPLYLEKAAEDSADDKELWIRYLNKYISSDGNKITESMYARLMESERLSSAQKRILKEAVIPGTATNLKVCSLSDKRNSLNENKKITLESANLPITDRAFELLNEKLADNGLNLDITCAGGFVLQTLGIRATMDVDAFYNASSRIESIINSVGEELGINDNEEDENWLNNSIANMNREPSNQYRELYRSYSNLNVYMVKPEYLIGMKLNSGREKDFKDVSLLIQKLNFESPVQLYKDLRKMKFKPDFADILGCFGDAYGHKWLATYYKDHAMEIADYM